MEDSQVMPQLVFLSKVGMTAEIYKNRWEISLVWAHL